MTKEINESEFREYVDYIKHQPMRDGEEIRNFFDDLNEEKGE